MFVLTVSLHQKTRLHFAQEIQIAVNPVVLVHPCGRRDVSKEKQFVVPMRVYLKLPGPSMNEIDYRSVWENVEITTPTMPAKSLCLKGTHLLLNASECASFCIP